MNKPLLNIYTYVDGVNDTPFPNSDNPLVISEYTYSDKRMGSVNLSASVMYPVCLDDLWVSGKQYCDFRGERYFIVKTPSSSKANDDVRYKHDIEFLAGRAILDTVYFYDVVTGNTAVDRYVSNSTEVLFYGDIHEFAQRLNYSLIYSGVPYQVVVDDGISSEAMQVQITNMFISNALQEIFNIYNLPFYFVGTTIHIGYTNNAITHTFRYGRDYELLSISKTNANYKITNRVTGTGSSENIQFYYPNPSNDRAAIEAAGGKWMIPSKVLLPSIYRETDGSERFYNAINNKYTDPQTGEFYIFENEYTTNNPKEHIVDFPDIKPTIKYISNAMGARIDMLAEVDWDDDDNDDIDETTGEYIHPYFYVRLRTTDGRYGFNLFEQAIVGTDATIVMTSGNTAPCKFVIGVVETMENGVQVFKNPVQVDKDGWIVPGNYAQKVNVNNFQEIQQNTMLSSVWIAVKKDNTTYGTVIPNKGQGIYPSPGDSFVITGINMPEQYIYKAEKELEEAIIKYMANNNREKFTFSIKLSRIFLVENPDISSLINSNARVDLEYNGKFHQLYISSYTYKSDSEIIPEISIELADTLSINKNSLETAIDAVKMDIMNSIGSTDFFKQGLKYFIRKDVPDTAREYITFAQGLKIGQYQAGANTGGIFTVGENGKISLETDFLKVRMKAMFETLEVVNAQSVAGKWYITPGGSFKCIKVEDRNPVYDEDGNIIDWQIWNYYRCYFLSEQDGISIESHFRVDDLAYSQDFNINYSNVHGGNHYYWRHVVFVGSDYVDLSKTDADTASDAPKAGDTIIQLGNKKDTSRMNAMVFSSVDLYSPSITLYQGIDNYSFTNKDYISYGVEKVPILDEETGEVIKTESKAFYRVYGESYIGARDATQYVKYEDGKVKIKGKLEVGTTIGDDTTIEKALEKVKTDASNQAVIEADRLIKEYAITVTQDLGELQRQIDGAVYSFFEKYDPTLTNLPASQWVTETEKQSHANDTFTNIETGNSWKWVKNGDVWEWAVITDTATLKALQLAAQAQDTADGKRRVFVRTPTINDEYDVGDLWVNATYGSYNNDILRCKTAKVSGIPFDIAHWEIASKYTDDTVANEAQRIANEAKARLEEWAADGVISPTEKQGIKDEIARIDADKNEITEKYKLYALYLGEPTAYNTAYTNYREHLVLLSATTPENITIPEDFSTRQTNYYNQRTAAMTAIATAEKNAITSVQDNIDKTLDEVNKVKGEVSNMKDFTDDAFSDGILTLTEYNTIKGYLKNIDTIQKEVDNSYTKVYNNPLLDENKVKTDLATTKSQFDIAINELRTLINALTTTITSTDRANFNAKYNNFNTKYGDFIAALNSADIYIQEKINDKAENALKELLLFKPVKDALLEKTLIDGGLILSSFLSLGYTDATSGDYVTKSGVNGVYDSTALGGGIAAWYGGSPKDYYAYSDADRPADVAQGVIRMDGTGYLAGGSFWWENDGTLHANEMSFFVGDWMVGNLLSAFQIVMIGNTIDYIIPKAPFQSLESSTHLQIGDGRLVWDSAKKAFYVVCEDGTEAGFYATGFVSARGMSPSSSVTPSVINSLGDIKDVTLTNLADDDILVRRNGNWVNIPMSDISGGGGGSVDGIILNGTTYSPDATTKLITLPNYPTSLPASDVYAWAKAANKPSYSYSEITGTPTIQWDSILGRPAWVQSSSKPNYTFAEISDKPTTLMGYGITDAYTKTQSDSNYVSSINTDTDGVTYFRGGSSTRLPINVSSAPKWSNARTLSLTGAVTGSVSIDGSSNVTLSTSYTNLDDRYRRLDITQFYDDRVYSRFWDNRISSGSGGWAFSPIIAYKADKTTIALAMGVTGNATNIDYMYIGLWTYENNNNLRIYSNGTVQGNSFMRRNSSDSYILLGGGGHRLISAFTSDYDARYVSSLGVSGNDLTWIKGGSTNYITVPYATNSLKLNNYPHSRYLLEQSGYGLYSNNVMAWINGSVDSSIMGGLTQVTGYFVSFGSELVNHKAQIIISKGWFKFRNCWGADDNSGWYDVALLTSNVASASKLYSTVSLWGQAFDGSYSISGALSGVTNINDSIYFSSGKIGIGTSTMTYAFNVDGGLFSSSFVRTYEGVYIELQDIYYSKVENIASISSNGGLICIDGGIDSQIIVNYRQGIKQRAPKLWIWMAGDSNTYADFVMGATTINGDCHVKGWFKIASNIYFNSDEYNPYMRLQQAGRFGYIQLLNNYLYLGYGSAASLRVDPSGNTYTPGNMLAAGAITARSQSSDMNLKTEVQDFNALSILRRTYPKQFKWNETAKSLHDIFNHNDINYGLIAQDIQYMPELSHFVDNCFGDYLVINYEKFIPILIQSTKEIDDEVSRMKREIDELKSEVGRLNMRITSLSA